MLYPTWIESTGRCFTSSKKAEMNFLSPVVARRGPLLSNIRAAKPQERKVWRPTRLTGGSEMTPCTPKVPREPIFRARSVPNTAFQLIHLNVSELDGVN